MHGSAAVTEAIVGHKLHRSKCIMQPRKFCIKEKAQITSQNINANFQVTMNNDRKKTAMTVDHVTIALTLVVLKASLK